MTSERLGLPQPANPLAAELEQTAHALPEIPRPYDQLRALLHSLPAGRPPDIHSARAGTAVPKDPTTLGVGGAGSALTGPPPGFDSGGEIGILPELFYGTTNKLSDPTMEEFNVIIGGMPAAPATQDIGAGWSLWYVLNSGTLPGLSGEQFQTRQTKNVPMFNSGTVGLFVQGVAAFNISLFLSSRRGSLQRFDTDDVYPYLVGACRACAFGTGGLTANYSQTLRVQICQDDGTATGGIVEAEVVLVLSNASADFRKFRQAVTRISGALASNGADRYLRFRIDVVQTDAVARNIGILLAEPIFAWARTERPSPFTPLIGRWIPDVARRASNESAASANADYVARIKVLADSNISSRYRAWLGMTVGDQGSLEFGSGAANRDVGIQRIAAGRTKFWAIATANATMFDIESTAGQTSNLRLYVAGDSVPRTLIFGDATGVGFQLSSGAATADNRVLRVAGGNTKFDSNGQAFTSWLQVQATAGQRSVLSLGVAGEAQERMAIWGDATLQAVEWGPGASVRDGRIKRNSAHWLDVDTAGLSTDMDLAVLSAATFQSRLRLRVTGEGDDRMRLEGGTAATRLLMGTGATAPIQVLGQRKTGWTVATGTAQRGTFATDTVTLINLARAVKALIDDLHNTAGHGIIGT